MNGATAAERLDRIARFSAGGPGVTRLPWTPEHRKALAEIRTWMEEAGLSAHLDAAGTLVGRSPNPNGKPTLLIGSHQDSVPDGGAFDGIMGIALACLAARRFAGRWDDLPFALEVLAFADEEGVRFPTALIGPRALAGTLDAGVFAMTDRDGRTMRDAMTAFGVDPDRAAQIARDPGTVLGYLEAHIEQGPVLETAACPIGVVTAICGIARHEVTIRGETGHAGTVPMNGRRDALVAAASVISEVSTRALAAPDIRATVGTVSVRPGAVNAIPSEVTFPLEVRAAEDAARDAFTAEIRGVLTRHCDANALDCSMVQTYAQRAVPCDPIFADALAKAADATGHAAMPLLSGATHDASAMADLCPIGMLFVPCRGGISHRPDEFTDADAMGAAVDVLAHAIETIGRRRSQPAV